MTDAIINFFENTLQNDILTIIVIAIFPIIELRGSIPVGVAMGMELWEAFLWAWVGSSLVCPVLLLILRPVLDWMKKTKWFRSLALAVESTFRSRADKVVKESDRNGPKKTKKKMLGVYAFVAVPLPLTGVWTGSAVAAFLDLSFGKALISVVAGNLTAGAIVTLLTYLFKDYVDIILTVFLFIVIAVLLLYIVMVIIKVRKNKKADKQRAIEDSAEKGSNSAQSEAADEAVAGETKASEENDCEENEPNCGEKPCEDPPTVVADVKPADVNPKTDGEESGKADKKDD